MGARLNVAVVGLGVGRQHAERILADERCRLQYLVDLDREKAGRAAREMGCEAADYDEVLADPSLDLLCLASYDQDHAKQALGALRAGKHVFCEKPLCSTLEELEELRRVWGAGSLHLGCNLILRAAPVYDWARRQIRQGSFGRIYALDADYLYGRVHKITEGWRGRVEGYSVIRGGGIHMLDLVLWLTGERPTRVRATGNRICTEGTSFRYRDYVSTEIEFASGLIARVSANFGCVHPHQHLLRIYGTRATLVVDDQGPRWFQDRQEPAQPLELATREAHKGDLLARFVTGIVEGDRAESSTLAMFETHLLCIRAHQALEQNKALSVQPPEESNRF